jgi:hypothetical protein
MVLPGPYLAVLALLTMPVERESRGDDGRQSDDEDNAIPKVDDC